jgi:hypothetical protein
MSANAPPAAMTPTELRLQLRAAGYMPLPIIGKQPPFDGWTTKTKTSVDEITAWSTQYPYAHSTGLLTQRMPTFDIDIKNQEASEVVEALVRERFGERGRILVRIGFAPKRAIPFRTDKPFKKIPTNFLAPDASTDQKLEFLGDGQQVVAFGKHKDTGKPYQWFGGEPGEIKLEDLPLINEAEAKLLGSVLAGKSWRAWRVLMIAAMGEALTDAERRAFLVNEKNFRLGVNNCIIKFDDLDLKGLSVVQTYHRLRDILQRIERSECGPNGTQIRHDIRS